MAPPRITLRFRSGGNLREGDFYVERAADRELYEALLSGEYCHVLAPRQIGKSSLRVSTERRLREQGVRCGSVDLMGIGDGTSGTPEQWYGTLIEKVSKPLKLDEEEVEAFWQRTQGTFTHRFIAFLSAKVLAADSAPVVLFLDEIDFIQRAPFRTDFFAGIRALYNLRAEEPELRRLTFCLIGVAAPTELIGDAAIHPFNIGKSIALTDFSRDEVEAFLSGLSGVPGDPKKLLSAIFDWTNGHPYMTQRLCEMLVDRDRRSKEGNGTEGVGGPSSAAPMEEERVAQLVKEIFLQQREVDPNLTTAEKRIEQSPQRSQLLRLYRRLLEQQRVLTSKEDTVQFELRLTGMAAERRDEKGGRWLHVRNRIFAAAFDQKWVDRKQPFPLLSQVVPLWSKSERNEQYLLRGQLLKDAQTWAHGRPDISADEREFLMAGLDLEKREEQAAALEKERRQKAEELAHARRIRIRLLLVMIALLSTALLLLFIQFRRAEKAKEQEAWAKHAALDAQRDALKQQRRAQEKEQLAQQEKAAADRERRVAVEALAREMAAKKQEEEAKQQAQAAAGQALAANRESQKKQQEAVQARNAAEQSSQIEKGARALILTKQPGREMEAVKVGIQAAGPSLPGCRRLALREIRRDADSEGLQKVVEGLIAAVTSVAYNAPQPDAQNREKRVTMLSHESAVNIAAFTPDGARLLTVGWDYRGTLWDRSGRRLSDLLGHKHIITSARFSGDGRSLVTASLDKTARLWEIAPERVATSPLRAIFQDHTDAVNSAEISPDGKQVITASRDGTIRAFDAATGRLLRRLQPDQPAVSTCLGAPRKSVPASHVAAVTAVAFSPDGRWILSGAKDCTARFWDATTGKSHGMPIEIGGDVNALSFSPDGTWAAVASQGGVVKLIRLASLEPEMTREYGAPIHAVVFSHASNRLLTASQDRRARIWDIARSGGVEFVGHHAEVYAAAFSRDDGLVATASKDGTARVWDARTGQQVATLQGAHGAVYSVDFSPDGKQLITAGSDRFARLYSTSVDDYLRLGCQLLQDRPEYAEIKDYCQPCLQEAGGKRQAK